MTDLVCLVADKNMEAALGGLLARPAALGIRGITHDVIVHPRRDPGCFHEATEFLLTYRPSHKHALVLLDHAWDGVPAQTGEELERLLGERLSRAGLTADWAEVIAVDPELEVWVFSDSPRVDECLGWRGRHQRLRAWLEAEGLWAATDEKPASPKEAVERTLHATRKPRSSAIYRSLASSVSVDRCKDRAFRKLRAILQRWFANARPHRTR
jgi:hypothetical protein